MTSSSAVWSLLSGPPGYRPQTPWGPAAALLITILVLLFAHLILPIVIYGLSPSVYLTIAGELKPWPWRPPLSALLGLLEGLTVIGLIWIFSGMRGGKRTAVLSLNAVEGGFSTHVLFTCSALLVMLPAGFAVSHVFELQVPARQPFAFDLSWLRPILPALIFVDIVAVAPISEEFVFRGFLLSALAGTRKGFWGAALLTTIIWVSLHASYPWYAFVIAFTWGMVLSFIIWRTGSLWTCIFAHSAYNMVPALFRLIFIQS